MAIDEAVVEGRMDVGEAVSEAAAWLSGMAMDIAMGLEGAAMDIAVGLDLGVAIGLACVRGQTRRITTVLAN